MVTFFLTVGAGREGGVLFIGNSVFSSVLFSPLEAVRGMFSLRISVAEALNLALTAAEFGGISGFSFWKCCKWVLAESFCCNSAWTILRLCCHWSFV